MEIFGIHVSNELLATLLLLLVDVIVFIVNLIRGRVKIVDSTREYILENLPTCILLAENNAGYDCLEITPAQKEANLFADIGKLDFATNLMLDLLSRHGIEHPGQYKGFIQDSIESILTTPQKKGVSYVTKKSESEKG